MAIKLMQPKELKLSLSNIAKNTAELRQQIQIVAIQAILSSIMATEKGADIANLLMDAVGVNRSLRRDSLVAYLERFGHFAWSKGDKKFAYFKHDDVPVGKITPEYEALVTAKMWDDAKREAEITSVYDMEAEVRKFIARMHKLTGDKAITIEKPEALAVVEHSFVRWSAETALKTMKADPAILAEGEKVDELVAKRVQA